MCVWGGGGGRRGSVQQQRYAGPLRGGGARQGELRGLAPVSEGARPRGGREWRRGRGREKLCSALRGRGETLSKEERRRGGEGRGARGCCGPTPAPAHKYEREKTGEHASQAGSSLVTSGLERGRRSSDTPRSELARGRHERRCLCALLRRRAQMMRQKKKSRARRLRTDLRFAYVLGVRLRSCDVRKRLMTMQPRVCACVCVVMWFWREWNACGDRSIAAQC